MRIPAAEIKAGTSASGKVYFTVYKENAVQFDEANCDALFFASVATLAVLALPLIIALTRTLVLTIIGLKD